MQVDTTPDLKLIQTEAEKNFRSVAPFFGKGTKIVKSFVKSKILENTFFRFQISKSDFLHDKHTIFGPFFFWQGMVM